MHHHHHRGSKSWQPASVNEDINLFLTTLIFSICLYPNSQTPSKWRNNGILCLDIFNWSPGFFTFSFIHSRVGLQQKLELDAEQSRDTTVDSRQQGGGEKWTGWLRTRRVMVTTSPRHAVLDCHEGSVTEMSRSSTRVLCHCPRLHSTISLLVNSIVMSPPSQNQFRH